jgi:high-affinity iron transporter
LKTAKKHQRVAFLTTLAGLPPAALIIFRESLEAGLVSAVILAYLRRSGRQGYVKYLYEGVVAGAALSAAVGIVLSFVLLEGGGFLTEAIGIIAGIAASTVLTYMVVWTAKHSSHVQERVEKRIDEALSRGYASGVAILAFATVFREGVEAVLFLLGLGSLDMAAAFGGTVFGLGASLVVLYLISSRLHRMRLGTIFKVSSVLLVVIASGMILHAANDLSLMMARGNVGGSLANTNAFDLGIPESSVFSSEGAVGGLLSAFTGFASSATWLAVILYLGYWAAALGLVYRAYRGQRPLTT